jgi:3-hydroxyisobutyrate dehydrogenase
MTREPALFGWCDEMQLGIGVDYSRSVMKIGFIGLGNMGPPMVSNLLKAGQTVVAFDINAIALEAVVAAGARAAQAPQQVVRECDIVFTMLPSPRHVRRVHMGEVGIFDSAVPSTLLVDCSTTDPQTTHELIEKASSNGLDLVDAPVSGGAISAKAGTLTFMVGAGASLFARVEPVLRYTGKNIINCGAPGNG